MQTKNLAPAQNARILPASPLRLRHSKSNAIFKAQKKKSRNTHQHSLETGHPQCLSTTGALYTYTIS